MISGKKNAGYLITILLTLACLLFAFKDVDIFRALDIIRGTSLQFLFLYLLAFTASHFLRSLRWKYMIASAKPDASSLNLFGATMLGYAVNCIFPRLGELYRAMFLGKWEGISRSSMLGTIVLERIIDVFALCAAIIISTLLYSGDLYAKFSWLKPALFIGIAGMFFLLFVLILTARFREKFYLIIVRTLGKFSPGIANKFLHVFEMLIDGFSSIKGRRNWLLTIVLSCLIIVSYALNSYLGFFMLGIHLGFKEAWILMTISSFGVIVPTPGGTGSYHLIAISVLSGLFALPKEVSSAYALLTHILSYLVFLGSALLLFSLINSRRKSEGKSRENFLSVFKNGDA